MPIDNASGYLDVVAVGSNQLKHRVLLAGSNSGYSFFQSFIHDDCLLTPDGNPPIITLDNSER